MRVSLMRFPDCPGSICCVRLVALDQSRSLQKIFGYEGWPQPERTNELAMLAFPAPHEDGFARGTIAGLDIGEPIANHVRVFQREIQLLSRLRQHADTRLSAGTADSQSLHAGIGMVKAVVGRIHVGPAGYERSVQSLFKFSQHFDLEMLLGDSGLIGNDHHRQPQLVEQTNSFGHAGKYLKLGGSERRVHDARFPVVDETVDYAVTIKKNCWCVGHQIQSRAVTISGVATRATSRE
jgi:hypothetical protein